MRPSAETDHQRKDIFSHLFLGICAAMENGQWQRRPICCPTGHGAIQHRARRQTWCRTGFRELARPSRIIRTSKADGRRLCVGWNLRHVWIVSSAPPTSISDLRKSCPAGSIARSCPAAGKEPRPVEVAVRTECVRLSGMRGSGRLSPYRSHSPQRPRRYFDTSCRYRCPAAAGPVPRELSNSSWTA